MSLPGITTEWREFTRTAALLLDPKAQAEQFYDKNTRPDGRLFSQARSTTIQQGILTQHAAGSAMVTLGSSSSANSSSSSDKPAADDDRVSTLAAAASSSRSSTTLVLAAVTLQVGQPTTSSDCPAGEGDVVVTVVDDVNKGSLANSSSSSNDTRAINVAILQSFVQRVLDVCIQSAVFVGDEKEKDDNNDKKKGESKQKQQHHPLVLIPGKAALRLSVSIQVLQAAGNVVDACVLAAVAALLNAQVPTPEAIHVEQDGVIWWKDETDDGEEEATEKRTTRRRLHFLILPIPLSMGLWVPPPTRSDSDDTAMDTDDDDNPSHTKEPCWIVDPDHVEEECLGTNITVVVNGNHHSFEEQQHQQSSTSLSGGKQKDVLLIDFSGATAIRSQDLALAIQMAKGRAQEMRSVLLIANKIKAAAR